MTESRELHPHPQEISPKFFIQSEFQFSKKDIHLNFEITGEVQTLDGVFSLPTLIKGERKDELWKTTCFEAFLHSKENSYFELNLALNGNWNTYSFSGYREGMTLSNEIELNRVQISKNENALSIRSAWLAHSPLPELDYVSLATIVNSPLGLFHFADHHLDSSRPDFHLRPKAAR